MAGRPVRFGVVGLRAGMGGVMTALRHGGQAVQLVGICDTDAQRLAEVHAKVGDAVGAFDDFGAMLKAGLDAVYIATPPPSHAPLSRQALEAGVHVHVEKPMATTEDDARAMVEAAERAGKRLSVGFELRGAPVIQRMQASIDAGEIGQPRAMTFIHSRGGWHDSAWRRTLEGTGGFFAECTIHEIDIMRQFGGEVCDTHVFAAPRTFPFYEDLPSQVTAIMDFDNGAQATLLVQHNVAMTPTGDPFAAKPTDEVMIRSGHWKLLTVAGETGALIWDHWQDILVLQQYVESPEVVRTVRREDLTIMPRHKLSHDMGGYALDFARRIALGQPPVQTGADALRSHQATWAMDRQIAGQIRG